MSDKAGRYRARYFVEGGNPFVPDINAFARQFKIKEVDLDDEQAAVKDKLAASAAPDGYNFVECVRIGDREGTK